MTNVRSNGALPPGPREELDISLPEGTLERLLGWFFEYGDIYRVFTPARGTWTYVISHPEHVRQVLVSNHRNYTKGLGIDRVKILLGNGLMASEGEVWRRQRRMIQPAFHRPVVLQYVEMMRRCNLALLDRWQRSAAQGASIDLTGDMSEVTLQIILNAVFGDDLGTLVAAHDGNPFALVTEESARNLAFARQFRALARLVQEVVQRRRREERYPFDLLSALIEARDKRSSEPMSDRLLVDEALTLVVAGHETTAAALNWTWYLLSQHPEAAQKLYREVDAVLGGRSPEGEDLAALPYTKQVIAEALRLYPPGWLLTRKAVAEDQIGGYRVPAGTDIFVSPYIIHRHPDYWDRPDAFLPERFAGGITAETQRFAYLPFAAGPRHCIGEFFAMVEMQMHVAMAVQRFRLSYVPSAPIELEAQVNLRTRHNLLMRPETRTPAGYDPR